MGGPAAKAIVWIPGQRCTCGSMIRETLQANMYMCYKNHGLDSLEAGAGARSKQDFARETTGSRTTPA